jgi:predicted CXXCH cytochrome family protein
MLQPAAPWRAMWVCTFACILTGCGAKGPPAAPAELEPARYVGGQVCAACHETEAALWRGSHHDLAMQAADEAAVRGNFESAELVHAGVVSTFSRGASGFVVRTDDGGGALADLPVSHTFGVEPLQQYLVPYPGGRYQALGLAWDTRPADEGGGRWFHLYPDERVDASHALHWTHRSQNWNAECAECHATNLDKGYDYATDAYRTTWTEMDVSCEACHGPGSRHAADTSVPVPLAAIARTWVMQTNGIAARAPAELPRTEVDACAQCHSRRSQSSEGFVPGASRFLDAFRPMLLDDGLYHADGQIQAEVYEYGSFAQSAMHAAGVTCTDCHDAHSAKLRASGDALCAQCHDTARFTAPTHHRHEPSTAGARCVACHMPATTYMVVDSRRDHSFRVPRPDLSAKLGVPNACTGCHQDRDADWAANAVANWYPDGRQTTFHYAEALAAGRSWAADRSILLQRVIGDNATPGIARATAVALLAEQLDEPSLEVVRALLEPSAVAAEEPLVVLAAIEALAAAPPRAAVDIGQRFLSDSSRALRMASARALLPARGLLTETRRRDLDLALEEYRAAQAFNFDRVEGQLNWAAALAALGRSDEAESMLRTLLAREPSFAAAYVNLADILARQGREADGAAALRAAMAGGLDDASLHFALGLSLVRSGGLDLAVAELERAVARAPANPHYHYTLGVALRSTRAPERGLEALRRAHDRFPGHGPTLLALATMLRDDGRIAEAASYAQRLVAVSRGDPRALALVRELER